MTALFEIDSVGEDRGKSRGASAMLALDRGGAPITNYCEARTIASVPKSRFACRTNSVHAYVFMQQKDQ